MKPQIVAMGGGGFATEPENLLLEKYVLGLSRNRARSRVCFLPTASGNSQNYIERFYTSFGELDVVASHLSLFGLTVRDIRAFLLEQDVIFIGGATP
jgi:dipeptidase E